MKTVIYVLIAILLLVVTFATNEGTAAVSAWIGIILLVFALVAINVRAASAVRKTISTMTGPITVRSIDRGRGSAIVPEFPAAGGTTGWMDLQIAGTHAFMRTVASVTDGDTVTAAGLAGADFEILALHVHGTQSVYSLPDPAFRFGEFAFHVVLGTVILLPVVIDLYADAHNARLQQFELDERRSGGLAASGRHELRSPTCGAGSGAIVPRRLAGSPAHAMSTATCRVRLRLRQGSGGQVANPAYDQGRGGRVVKYAVDDAAICRSAGART